MEEEMTFEPIKDYQDYLKQRQELMAYCKKINQGIENLDEKSGERAIWELVQNARDMDENSHIRIELRPDKIVFSHRGKPFDYTSLLALVNQNSSKDNPGADLVGQYGTGFMTTHAFCDIVKVSAPYKVMSGPEKLIGYVYMQDLELNRSYRNNLEKAIEEMRSEIKLVDNMHKTTPLYPTYDSLAEEQKWTSFTYRLESSNVDSVSKQLASAIRLMPFVLVINERIKEIEVKDLYAKRHFRIIKKSSASKQRMEVDTEWYKIVDEIETTDILTGKSTSVAVTSLQLFNEDGKVNDVVILPPYPEYCGSVDTIPSLFLCFPLLGTESFGVNFIFHSKRWYPVEKRNNIMLPENVPSKREKGALNEEILHEMMATLHRYYAYEGNANSLNRDMCLVNFHSDKKNEVTTKFYTDLQNIWKAVMPSWKVIPTEEGKRAMNDARVRVLHPDFYSKLTEEKQSRYELTLAEYAKNVKYNEKECYLLPTSDLIAWSKVVHLWRCDHDSEFYVTVKDVCKSVQEKSDILHCFLSFLVDSDNTALLDDYELLPNRNGNLKRKGDLRHGDFMTASLYTLTEMLMGSDADRMIDTAYNNIGKVATYKPEDLQRSINQTISKWRTVTFGSNKTPLTIERLDALIAFSSATSQTDFNNYRGRMMPWIVRIHEKQFARHTQPKIVEKEDDFYNPAFNLLLDYTLYVISQKDEEWVKDNEKLLKDFLTEYATSNAKERLERLNEFAVIPNYNYQLCTKDKLSKNINICEDLVKFYQYVIKEDLHEHWVHDHFSTIFTYNEEKASEVANKIETALNNGDFQDTVVLDIIELAENEPVDNWKILFKSIYNQRESIRYKLGTPAERRAINRIMKKKNPELLELMADVAEREDAKDFINNVNKIIDQIEHDAYIKMLGTYVESHIQKFLAEALEPIGIAVNNEQCGQDFVLSKQGYENYHVEVKSRWKNDQSVEMSSTQFKCAVDIPDRYALISVNMCKFDNSRAEKNNPMKISEIYDNIKCLDNIGTLEADLCKRVDEAFKGGEQDIRLNGAYKVRVPQSVFKTYPLDFNGLLERIKKHFS